MFGVCNQDPDWTENWAASRRGEEREVSPRPRVWSCSCSPGRRPPSRRQHPRRATAQSRPGRNYKYFPFWQIFFRRFLTSSSRLIIGPTDPLNLKSCLISPGDNVDAGHDECNQTRFFRLHPILRVSKLMKIFLYYYKYFYIAINIFRKMMWGWCVLAVSECHPRIERNDIFMLRPQTRSYPKLNSFCVKCKVYFYPNVGRTIEWSRIVDIFVNTSSSS